MKKLVEEVSEEGLEKLIGKRITLYCFRYIYTGKLIGISDDCVLLSDCGIVYDTGESTEGKWKNYEKFPNDWYVNRSSIESFGIYKQN